MRSFLFFINNKLRFLLLKFKRRCSTLVEEKNLNFDVFFQSWINDTLNNDSTNHLVKDLKIKTLRKKKMFRLKGDSIFSLFNEKKDTEKELQRIGKKIAGDSLMDDPDIFFNDLFEGTDFKFESGKQNELSQLIIEKTSKKGFSACYLFRLNDVMFVGTDKGCKNSYVGRTYASGWNVDYGCMTAVDTYSFIGMISALKELDKLAAAGFDFSELLRNVDEKLWRLPDDDEFPSMELPSFGSDEVAKTILGDKAVEVSKSRYKFLYSLVYEKKTLLPEKKKIHFRRGTEGYTYGLFGTFSEWKWHFLEACDVVIRQEAASKRNHLYEKEVSGDYARSFQTKKHINKRTVEAMKKSGFNRFFDFVEFDNEVDLGKVDELYKEFKEFNKFIFGECVATPETKIRFRKLGQHKASGLYYPAADCICVDIDEPHSLIHEYGHMLDYHNGMFSESSGFRQIRDLYECLLKANIKESKISLNGKYNEKYYMVPTEIFARCFEIYCKTKGVDNSIIQGDFNFAYPTEERFVGMIMNYFDEMIKNLN